MNNEISLSNSTMLQENKKKPYQTKPFTVNKGPHISVAKTLDFRLTQTVDFYQRFSDPDFSIGNRELFSKKWKILLGFESRTSDLRIRCLTNTPADDENYQFNSGNYRNPKQNSCFISIRLVFILKQIWFCSIIILKGQQ